ncbi:MAG: tyrosine-type recombinase/integrase [Saprospiraceae bacterium]|nr:tyrosine-type recombinase/integrase [Saprospiraceae bacterium]MCF8252158.1 tyrosine-type recombinase/integrase [Saprospiraceae bacterium]MCF8282433.1 tyrosine-type recombinase/integrase [Bacteroidales bacterium]MCF8313827.1 tyrosine-type recombinase/integrase [Saprospiraceae bacterium]MCF8442533.1 tyrosine-type recombinase/integrase [Saprospiraceae bacterium]
MIESSKKIRLVPSNYQDILANHRNRKTKLQAMLMLDCGLRVSEVVKLKVKHFDFYRRVVNVESLKKRESGVFRPIPMTDRVFAALADWYERMPDRKNPETWLFPAGKGSHKEHMDRKQVWRRVKKWTDGVASPHDLRHTFATRIVSEGNDIRVAQKLLGHASQTTTEIYLHVPQEQLRRAIRSLERKSWGEKVFERFFPKKPIHILPVEKGLTKYHIGRKDELAKLYFLSERKINTLIIGPQGIGKSHLADNYTGSENIIRIDEMTAINKMLSGWICAISEKFPERTEMLYNDPEKPVADIVEKKAIKFLVEDLIALTTKGEWTLIIDDVSNITPRGINTLERLKNHFHIICCARKVEVKKGTFLSNFERIDLKPLPRAEATELAMKLSRSFLDKVEDIEAFKNHIWENTVGVPLFIYEMVERYSKEEHISLEIVKEVRHTAAVPETNAAPFVIGFLASFSVLRYAARAIGGDMTPIYILTAIGMLFLIFGRQFITATKRKYV